MFLTVNESQFSLRLTLTDLKFLNNHFFSKSKDYSTLPDIKRKLFENEFEYEKLKYDFRDKLFKYKMNFVFLSTFISISSFIGYDYIIPYITFRRRFFLKMKVPFSVLFGVFSYKLISNFYLINLSDIATPNSKFTLYAWFETHFRNYALIGHLSDLDFQMSRKFDHYHLNRSKNISQLEFFLFYHDLKSHYLNLLTVNQLLFNLNGRPFHIFFNKYRHRDLSEKEKEVINSLRKGIVSEYNKLLHSKQEQLKAKIEVPILTKENYMNYIDPTFLVLIDFEETMRRIFLKEYLVIIEKTES